MYHFFAAPAQIEGAEDGAVRVDIAGEDYNHIRHVLRMRPGETVLISSRAGGDYLCRLEEYLPDRARFLALEKREEDMELPARIFLFQGLPKGDKMEWIIQKAVELGVYAVVPVVTERTVVRLDAKKAADRRRRWQAVSESAAKQAKRSLVPEIGELCSLKEALERAAGCDLRLFLYEDAAGIEQTRRALAGARPGMEIAVLIGPEGGFAKAEEEAALAAGFQSLSLGKRILRTETAGLCVLSALMLNLEGREETKTDGSVF